jgi:hypothetical protein
MAAADFCGGSARAKLRLEIWIKGKEASSGCLKKRQGMTTLPNPGEIGHGNKNLARRIRVELEAEEEDTVAWGSDVSGTKKESAAATVSWAGP